MVPIELNPTGGANKADIQRFNRTARVSQSSWHGTAFIIEALILLAFLAGCIAVFMQLFAHSHAMGADSAQLSQAVIMASNVAERFEADPSSVSSGDVSTADLGISDVEGFTVHCEITPETTDAGTLYRANIVVTKDAEEVYTIETAKYVSAGHTSAEATEEQAAEEATAEEAAAEEAAAAEGEQAATEQPAEEAPASEGEQASGEGGVA